MPEVTTGPNGPEPSKPLARAHCGKGRVAVENVVGGDVVDAGVAEDEFIGLVSGNLAAGLADDDAEFALIGGLAVIG